jgi:hypothetical protein
MTSNGELSNRLLLLATLKAVERKQQQEAKDAVLMAKRLGIEPDDWQSQVLRSEERNVALCCSRQCGKSLTVAILALHRAIYCAGSLVLVIAPSQRQSVELSV